MSRPGPEIGVTLDQALAEAAAALKAAGLPEARREAWRIWTDLDPQGSRGGWMRRADPAEPAQLERFRLAIERRAAGEPVAYVTGTTGFRRLTLRTDRRALIPRPETEGLVDLVLERVPTGVAVDVGTGTGCIALSLAQEGSYGSVVALDRSRAALALARENRALTGLPVHLVLGDLVTGLGAGQADVIVANPPYVTAAEHEGLDRGVREYEPTDALVSGDDGLRASERLARDARRVVRRGGWLALELDARRAGETARLTHEAGWDEVTIHQDLFGRARYLLARRSEMP